ncbi:MAG: integrase family protein [Alphaproteobacteria bacterium]|nr:integrase family protein [Alphaproteobacteria bacterium]
MTKYKSYRRLLTDAFCASAAPGIYSDVGCPGLRLNVSHLARRTFQHQYQITGEGKMSEAGTGNRLRGKIKKLRLGHFPTTSLAEARALVVTQRLLTSEGINPRAATPAAATHVEGADVLPPVATGPAGLTFAGIAEAYNEQNETKTAALRRRDLKTYILPRLGHLQFKKITRSEVGDALTEIEAEAMAEEPPVPTRTGRMQKAIQSVFRYGIKKGKRDDNPTGNLDFKPAPKRVKQRIFDHGELRALWTLAEGDRFGAAFRFLLLSGLRRSEVSLMKFADVDMLRGVWTIPAEDRKLGVKEKFEDRKLKLSDALLAIIDAQPRRGAFVFTCKDDGSAPISGWGKWKIRITDKAKLPDWRIHDTRHSFITTLADRGIGVASIAAVTGHSLRGAIATYIGDTPVEQRRVLETWAAYVFPADTGTVVRLPEAGAA